MDRSAAQAWLDACVKAWKRTTPTGRGAVRTGCTYRYRPYDPDNGTVRGREAIVRD